MFASPPSEPPGLSTFTPPWRKRRGGSVSGGVKCSLITDERSKPPPFWQPRPKDPSSSEQSTSHSSPTPSTPVRSTASSTPERRTNDIPQWTVETDEAAAWGYVPPTPSSPPPRSAALSAFIPTSPTPSAPKIPETPIAIASTSTTPTSTFLGAAFRARAVSQTFADPGLSPDADDLSTSPWSRRANRSSSQGVPPTPTSPPPPSKSIPISTFGLPAYSASPPSDSVSTDAHGNLNAQAQAFVPGQQRPTTTNTNSAITSSPSTVTGNEVTVIHAETEAEGRVPSEDVDLNAYIRQSASQCPSPSPSPKAAMTPRPGFVREVTPPVSVSDDELEAGSGASSWEEDMEMQWRQQMQAAANGGEEDMTLVNRDQWAADGEPSMSSTIANLNTAAPRLDAKSDISDAAEPVVGTVKLSAAKDQEASDVPPRRRRATRAKGAVRSVSSGVMVTAVSPFGRALARARMIVDFDKVGYPEDVSGPNPALMTQGEGEGERKGVLRYERDFLLQFHHVCTARPASFPSIDAVWLHVLPRPNLTFDDRESQAQPARPPAELPLSKSDSKTPADGLDETTVEEGPCSSRTSTATVVGSLGGSKGDVSLDEQIRDARLDRLEKRVATLDSEVAVLRLEIARLRGAGSA